MTDRDDRNGDLTSRPTRTLRRETPLKPEPDKPAIAATPSRVPSQGDVVLYHFRGPDGMIRSRPAIVTSVVSAELVNARVMFEPADLISLEWVASVRLCDDGPIMAGTWSWPRAL